MELLRGTAPKVTFYGPTPSTDIDTVTVSVNGVESSAGAPVLLEGETAAWELQLPYLGSDTNDVEVTWHFTIEGLTDSFDETFSYEVVTPYLSKQEIKAIYPEVTDSEYVDLEASVRHIINANTGQKFGFDRAKTLTVEGHGESALRLPERLVAITGVNTLTSSLSVSAFIIVSDGWYLKKAWADATPRAGVEGSQFWGDINGGAGPFDNSIYGDYDRSDDSVDTLYGPLGHRPGGIIVPPGASGRATAWKDDYPFEITGDWGYKTIPANVKEAAKLLVNDYACSEIAYRDRYLESIRAADWRLQYNSRAWESTGNVRADQLLSDYVLLDWAVV